MSAVALMAVKKKVYAVNDATGGEDGVCCFAAGMAHHYAFRDCSAVHDYRAGNVGAEICSGQNACNTPSRLTLVCLSHNIFPLMTPSNDKAASITIPTLTAIPQAFLAGITILSVNSIEINFIATACMCAKI